MTKKEAFKDIFGNIFSDGVADSFPLPIVIMIGLGLVGLGYKKDKENRKKHN